MNAWKKKPVPPSFPVMVCTVREAGKCCTTRTCWSCDDATALPLQIDSGTLPNAFYSRREACLSRITCIPYTCDDTVEIYDNVQRDHSLEMLLH